MPGIHSRYHYLLFCMPFIIAYFGSYACITLYEQYRLLERRRNRNIWYSWVLVLLMSLSFGGVTIWCMHYVSLSGVRFLSIENLHLEYRIDLTIISFLSSVALTCIGILIASIDPDFTDDRMEVQAKFVEEAKKLSISQLRNLPNRNEVIGQSLFRNMRHLSLAAFFVASGVCVMHFIGMLAMVFDGHIIWKPGYVAASVILAYIVSWIGLWLIFRLLTLFPDVEIYRLISSFIIAAAVNGVHHAGMAAGDIHYDPETIVTDSKSLIGQDEAIVYSMFAASLFLWISFTISIADLRSKYFERESFQQKVDVIATALFKSGHSNELFLNGYFAIKAAVNARSNAVSSAFSNNLVQSKSNASSAFHRQISMPIPMEISQGSPSNDAAINELRDLENV